MSSTAVALPLPHAAEPPAALRILVFLLFATSSIVLVEPAPCDLLFPLVFVPALIFGQLAPPERLGMKVMLPLCLAVIANLASAFFSVDFGVASFYMAVTFYLLLLFWFVAAVVARHGPAIAEWIARGFVWAAGITATIGLLARFRLIPMSQMFFRDESGLRVKSTFKDPNVFGPFLVAGAIVLLSSLVHSRRMRVRDGVLFVLCSLGVLLSFSRGAWLHFGVSLGLFAAIHLLVLRGAPARRRLIFSGVGVGIVLIPLLGWLLTSPDLGEYFGKRLSFQDYDSERFGSQARALRVAVESPLGLGPGQWMDWRFGLSPHNVYLRVPAENGFLGLLAFLLLIGVSVSQAVAGILARGPCANFHVVSLSIVAGVLVESLVIDTLHWRHFWVFLALPIGLRAFERARRPRSASVAGGRA